MGDTYKFLTLLASKKGKKLRQHFEFHRPTPPKQAFFSHPSIMTVLVLMRRRINARTESLLFRRLGQGKLPRHLAIRLKVLLADGIQHAISMLLKELDRLLLHSSPGPLQ
jgi:hypothetical protein